MRLFPKYAYLWELVLLWIKNEDIHAVKTRQMVITTLLCGLFLHGLLFEDSFSGIMLSRKDRLVDDGGENSTWDSLLGKIRFMYNHLPEHLKQDVTFVRNRITNNSNGSYIVGESGNVPDAGRGGVYTRGLMDEAAKIPWSESVYAALRDACRSITMNSTPNGKTGVFARINFAEVTRFHRVRLGWHRHPNRDQQWYDKECIDRTPEQIAEELDMSFSKSVAGRCIPEFDYQTHVKASAIYNPSLPLTSGWDFGIGDPNAVLFWQQEGLRNWIPGSIQAPDMITKDFSEVAVAKLRQIGYSEPPGTVESWGDGPTGAKRNSQTGYSDIDDFYKHGGWLIQPVWCDEKDRLRLWRRLFKAMRLTIHPDNVALIDCCEQHHYPLDRDGRKVEGSEKSALKSHQYSHLIDGGGYRLVGCESIGPEVTATQVAGI